MYSSSLAQAKDEQITIKGRITDIETNEPLTSAAIGIPAKNIGTISNFLGEFELHLPKKNRSDTLQISMLGYKNYMLTIENIASGSEIHVRLKANAIVLEEVVVTGKPLTAKQIVKKVRENIPVNHTTSPYILEAFARWHKSECGEYKYIYETTLDLFGTGYRAKGRHVLEKIYLKETRQSARVDYYHTGVLRTEDNSISMLRYQNDLLTRRHSLAVASNKYELENYTMIEGRLVYVIKGANRAGGRDPNYYQMWVDAKSFALLKTVWEKVVEGDKYVRPSSDSTQQQMTSIKRTVQFEKTEGKYYPKYINVSLQGKLFKIDSRDELCDWEIQFEMMVDEILDENITEPSPERLMSGDALEMQLNPYNASFWRDYQLIKDFPINDHAIKDLGGKGVLELQFQRSYDEMEAYKAKKEN